MLQPLSLSLQDNIFNSWRVFERGELKTYWPLPHHPLPNHADYSAHAFLPHQSICIDKLLNCYSHVCLYHRLGALSLITWVSEYGDDLYHPKPPNSPAIFPLCERVKAILVILWHSYLILQAKRDAVTSLSVELTVMLKYGNKATFMSPHFQRFFFFFWSRDRSSNV